MSLFAPKRVLSILKRRPICLKSYTQASRRFYALMAQRNYDDAIDLLNSLQTPYKVLKEMREAGVRIDYSANEKLKECLTRLGYTQDLEKLNISHVAGTKGKGSTCAYIDSILSHHRKSHGIPQKTGLFTSPHLIAVRERIRIDSIPITAELFAKYFFEVWDALSAPPLPFDKPVYFRFLTLLSYHVFLREGVHAAVYEVGVGGEYDSTNVVDKPAVTGISTLGIDHTFTLGETIDKIAWHKAGIQKNGVPSFTVKQVDSAMAVLEERAKERGVEHLNVVGLDPRLDGVRIKPDADFQKGNASLAIALAEKVLKKLDPNFQSSSGELLESFVDGLEQVVWRGRCETKKEGNITWYLDGAHTADSILVATQWFGLEASKKYSHHDRCTTSLKSLRSGPHVLIFNQQGHREALELVAGLHTAITSQNLVNFDHVIFCPNAPQQSSTKKDFVNHTYDSEAIANLTLQKELAAKWQSLDSSPQIKIVVLPSVEHALAYVRDLDLTGGNGVQALVTGSVHLIGRVLGALEEVDAV